MPNPGSFTWVTPQQLQDPIFVNQYPGLQRIRDTNPSEWAQILQTAGVAQSLGANPAGSPAPPADASSLSVEATQSTLNTWPWILGTAVYAYIIFSMADSEKYGGVALALAWLVAGGVVLTKFFAIEAGYHQLLP